MKDLQSSLKERIRKKAETVLNAPYHNTETLADAAKRLNLKGCPSVRIERNFRMVFVICEECRAISDCEFCSAMICLIKPLSF